MMTSKMRRKVFLTLLPLVLHAHAKHSIDDLADQRLDKLVQRVRQATMLRKMELDDTTVGKYGLYGHVAVHPCAVATYSRPQASSCSIASVQLSQRQVRRRCIVLCTAGSDDAMEKRPGAALWFGRRGAAIALGGFAVAVAQPPVLAADKFITASEGVKYYDFVVGSGETPVNGDVLEVMYSLKVMDTDAPVEVDKLIAFGLGTGEMTRGWDLAVLGAAQMPPMKVGGIRNVVLPAKLAYGAQGAYCTNLKGECLVPPDSAIQVTIELLNIQSRFRTFLQQRGVIPRQRTVRPAYCSDRYAQIAAGGNKGDICNSEFDTAQWGAALVAIPVAAAAASGSSPISKFLGEASTIEKTEGNSDLDEERDDMIANFQSALAATPPPAATPAPNPTPSPISTSLPVPTSAPTLE